MRLITMRLTTTRPITREMAIAQQAPLPDRTVPIRPYSVPLYALYHCTSDTRTGIRNLCHLQ
eukprot:1194660-Prorocentrum_minimum.AAC.3